MTRPGSRRTLLAGALLLLATVVLAACSDPQTTLEPRSDSADRIDDIYRLVFWLAGIVFVLVLAATLVFSLWFRERPGREAKQIHGNTRLEVIWTLIPVVIIAVIAVPTFQAIIDEDSDPPENALTVEAVGHQWWFEFNYPEYGISTSNELHIPVDRAVAFDLEAVDVIHSFWIPQLAGKIDMIPGRTNTLWFTPNEVRAEPYLGQCAEFCGLSHANMRFRVYVHTQADFEAWVQKMQAGHPDADAPSEELLAQGQQAFLAGGCVGCHTINGSSIAVGVVGPNLTDIGSRGTIGAGILENNTENLTAWIKNAPSLKPGIIMPVFEGTLTDEQIAALVAYLQSLK